MPQAEIIHVLIASPGDLEEERKSVPAIFARWNERNSGIFLQPVMWEYSGIPALGDHPQHILKEQLIPKCEFLVAMLWSRAGTKTSTALSGTVEEIREFSKRKGADRVMLYFCMRPVAPDTDLQQLGAVQEFRKEMDAKGLCYKFTDLSDFKLKLDSHLDSKIKQHRSGSSPQVDQPLRRETWQDIVSLLTEKVVPDAVNIAQQNPLELSADKANRVAITAVRHGIDAAQTNAAQNTDNLDFMVKTLDQFKNDCFYELRRFPDPRLEDVTRAFELTIARRWNRNYRSAWIAGLVVISTVSWSTCCYGTYHDLGLSMFSGVVGIVSGVVGGWMLFRA